MFLEDKIQYITSIDDIIIDFFNNNLGAFGNIVLGLICIILACILSGIIGFERESRGHAAGFRTHILVSVGSALIMYLSIYGFSYDLFPNHDPARLAAQVVTGIGFLGAGAIMKTGVDIKGLTTATTLWIVMAIGLACGSGKFVIAILSTIIVFVVLKFLRKFEKMAQAKNPQLSMICDHTFTIKSLKDAAAKYNITIKSISTTICTYNGLDAISVHIVLLNAKKDVVTLFGEELRLNVKPYEIKY